MRLPWMHRRRRSGLLALAAAALLAGVLTPPAGAASLTAAPGTAPPPTAAPGVRSLHTLITGDTVAVGSAPDGRPTVSWLSGHTAGAGYQLIAGGGHLYVLPVAAAPLLGGTLSLELFDLTTQPQAAGATLTVGYRGAGRKLPAGLTATGPGTARVTDPAAFGRAIAEQGAAARQHRTPRLGDLATVAPAKTARTSKKEPAPGALHTLRVRGIDRTGQPAEATVLAVNVESADTYIAGQTLFQGAAAFSVPTGHYSISGFVPTTRADNTVEWTLVALPEVTVRAAGSVTLDARRAVPITATTPTPADELVSTVTYQRTDTVGSGLTQSFTTFGPAPLSVVPAGPVQVGGLSTYVTWNRASADGTTSYDLVHGTSGSIPADWTYRPGLADLGTVHARYASPIPGRTELTERIGLIPGIGVLSSVGHQIAAPVDRTEYVSAAPDLIWVPDVYADGVNYSGLTYGPVRTFAGGQQVSEQWLGQPMASGVGDTGLDPLPCPLCLQDGVLSTSLEMLVDSAGHRMLTADGATQQLTLSKDGVTVGESPGGQGTFPLTADGRYTLDYDVTLTAPWWTTSTHSATRWSFDSTDTEPLPAGWTCGGGKGKAAGRGDPPPPGGGPCLVPALLVPSYTTPAGADTVQPAGSEATVDVRVARPAGAGQVPIEQLTAQVSFDDGADWTTVTPTRTGPDTFRLVYPQPELADSNGFAAIRIAATDQRGASVAQTVTRAYPLAVTSAPPPPGNPPARERLSDLCTAAVAAPFASCHARISPSAQARSAATPDGLSPADIRSAYGLSPKHGSGGGSGRTVAVVVAYDSPAAEADLAIYRAQWGLPPCTSADGCFRRVNQTGAAGPLPSPGFDWSVEAALDLDSVSATCPDCRLLLVEADSASLNDLLNAALTAYRLGADVISNSYGSTGEFSGEQLYEPYYRSIRVPFVVSTGDYGYGNGRPLIGGVSYPAASASAIAVGGTSLVPASSPRGWTESAWIDGTSGCSAYIDKPHWQRDTLCRMRTVADISAVGDPATGLAVYQSTVAGGWVRVGGTSLSAPLIAGMYASAGPGRQPGRGPIRFAESLYRQPGAFTDVTTGVNGTNCSNSYLCTAVRGFDGPTGLGTPKAVTVFAGKWGPRG